ncbi:MAG: hypothetical protein GWP06_18175, partial [Actinobacteria bacterium]|nr:hypothetical protein [Actinomycetota bacterium]
MKRIFFIILSLLTATSVFASHNPSRYFPFLERPEEYISQGRSYVYSGLFITNAATAFKGDGGNLGIPELWGEYNLKQVIESLNAVKTAAGQGPYNPFSGEPGYVNYNQKDLIFNVDGKIKSRGIIVSAEQKLFRGFSAGFFLPIMRVNSTMNYQFNSDTSHVDLRSPTKAEVELFDRVRRTVHTDLGLKGGDWSKTGIGDLDLHLGWRHYWDHKLKMRGIDFNLKAGVLFPIGTKRDENYPSSIPFMGNGHWGVSGDIAVEFELKQNWKVGFIGSYIHQFPKTKNRRASYFYEPTIFSAVSGDIEVDRGRTL